MDQEEEEGHQEIETKNIEENKNYQSHFMNFLAVQDGFCDVCGKSVNHLKNHITEHIKSISKKKPKSKIKGVEAHPKDHKCNSCEKSFSHLRKLTKHIKTVHERHRDLKCDPCGKSFSDAGNLKKHISVHEEKKDLKCDVCGNGKNYSHKGLKSHLFFCRKYNPTYHQNGQGKN